MVTNVKDESRLVFEKLLLNTGFMEGAEDEVEIWRHCLTTVGSDVVLFEFFQDIIKEASTNTASHFKMITEVSKEISFYTGKSTSNIDELLDCKYYLYK